MASNIFILLVCGRLSSKNSPTRSPKKKKALEEKDDNVMRKAKANELVDHNYYKKW